MRRFEVRRARPGDAAGIADMFNALDREDLGDAALCPFTPQIVLRDAVGEASLLATEVAVADGNVIGAAAHNLAYHAETARPARWLEMLYVVPEWRKAGVGRALMHAVSRAALAGGCDAVFWAVRRHNDGGADFYDRLGAGDEDANVRVLLDDALRRLTGEIAEGQ
ncbi:GNAT family N-acetyltransferase [Minwuia sp.]|uniref:GNAT family N-acetyltransferase n=1 Tax=Minwuia sp. TaxID=2493630 RepID=UPI003A8E7343